MRRNPEYEISDATKLRIVDGLLEMRRSGLLRVIYCDADRLRIGVPGSEILRRISWIQAAKIAQVPLSREFPPLSSLAVSPLVLIRRIG